MNDRCAFTVRLIPLFLATLVPAFGLPAIDMPETQLTVYYWKSIPVGDTAQLLTLVCRECRTSNPGSHDLPLVSILRDTLGDTDPRNDRVMYVWLLSYKRPNIGQRILSAVPFFYWRVGERSGEVSPRDTVAADRPAGAGAPRFQRI